MPCSPEQLAANRANSQKSCGPKTEAGKAISRGNALKHGLTGEGIVLPAEDVEVIERRFAGFERELGADDEATRFLARHAAGLSVRLDRCMIEEAAATSQRIRSARADFDNNRSDEADRLIESIHLDPGLNRRALLKTAEGLTRLIDAFREVRANLSRGLWADSVTERVDDLMGRQSVPGRGHSPERALVRSMHGEHRYLDSWQGGDLDDRGRRDWSVRELAARLDAEIAMLEARCDAIDDEAVAKDRAEAASRALFDPSPRATLARKYEAAAERAFHKTLDRIEAIKKARAQEPTPEISDTNDSSPKVSAGLGSFFPDESAPADPVPQAPECDPSGRPEVIEGPENPAIEATDRPDGPDRSPL